MGDAPIINERSVKPRSPNPRKRGASAQARLESDSDEGESDIEDPEARAKRVRLSSEPEPDLHRQIRSVEAFTVEDNEGQFAMVHAADIAANNKPAKFKPAFPGYPDRRLVSLQYPSASPVERYRTTKSQSPASTLLNEH